MKRTRIIKAKWGQLRAAWRRLAKEPYNGPSMCYAYGGGGAASRDAHLLCQAVEGTTFIPQANGTYTTGPSLLEQLDANGRCVLIFY